MRAGEREEIIGAGAREMDRLVDAFSTLAVPTTEANEGAEALETLDERHGCVEGREGERVRQVGDGEDAGAARDSNGDDGRGEEDGDDGVDGNRGGSDRRNDHTRVLWIGSE